MISDDVLNSLEIVAYCESYLFKHVTSAVSKKCLQCHLKSMFTKHQKAERKMMFIICNVLKLFFFKKNDKGLDI